MAWPEKIDLERVKERSDPKSVRREIEFAIGNDFSHT